MPKRKKEVVKFKNKRIIIFFLFISLILLFLLLSIAKCGDGTWSGKCSQRKPYFCLRGKLVEKASVCGCPETLTQKNETCISDYHTNPKNISLKYILKGKEGEMNFVVYEGFANYSSKLPRYIFYDKGEVPSRRDFKMLFLNEERQRDMLSPLIAEIQNLNKNEIEQVRIAISLVQNIPFGNSNKTSSFGNSRVNYFRYPYEVLYDYEGICSEKSLLLAFILRELGYSTAIFYYAPENHEAVGIKCPKKYSINQSGYCFVETTAPSIITDDKIDYLGIGKLYSKPEIIPIFYGKSLKRGIHEYKDAKKLIKLRESRILNIFKIMTLKRIKKKYGLVEIYNP